MVSLSVPTWITNIFTGLSNIDITSYAGSARILQVMLAIITIGLSGNLINTNGSSLTSQIDDLLGDTSEVASALSNLTSSSALNTSVSLSNLKGTSGVALASSLFTSLATTSLSLLPYAFSRELNTMVSSSGVEELNGIFSTLSTSQTAYVTSLTGSELASILLWGANSIYGTAKYGSWDCSDPEALLIQYNDSSSTDLSLFNELISFSGDYNDSDLDNTTLALLEEWEELYSLFNSTIDISGANLSTITAKQQFLIELAQDCSMKKASIAVGWLTVVTFLFSGALLSISASRLSNGETTASTSTTSSSSSSITSASSFDLLSIRAEFVDDITKSEDMTSNANFIVSNINVAKTDKSKYRCSFDLKNSEAWSNQIHTTLLLSSEGSESEVHVQGQVMDKTSGPSGVASASSSVLMNVQNVFASDSGDKVELYMTVDFMRILVTFDVGVPKYASSSSDVEMQDITPKYKLVYSRALLFPHAVEIK